MQPVRTGGQEIIGLLPYSLRHIISGYSKRIYRHKMSIIIEKICRMKNIFRKKYSKTCPIGTKYL